MSFDVFLQVFLFFGVFLKGRVSFGVFGVSLGVFWGVLGDLLGLFGPLWGLFGPLWGVFGASLGLFGSRMAPILVHPGSLCNPGWPLFSRFFSTFCGLFMEVLFFDPSGIASGIAFCTFWGQNCVFPQENVGPSGIAL